MKNRSIHFSLSTQEIFRRLFRAIPYLDPSGQESIATDCQILRDLIQSTKLRIAVFAPFNSGKSTIINTLVGQAILPMGVVATTACPIIVKYGDILKTVVTYQNGQCREFAGVKILDSVAVLNKKKSGTENALVEVYLPWLADFKNIEYIDLPGTEDQEILDEIVKYNLLKADVIIFVVYALKMFSQPEREKIKEWLLVRGIDSVLFVLNFLNLVENHKKNIVWINANRMVRTIQTDLPLGSKKLYRVDALPAFQARNSSNLSYKALANSGFIKFEAALKTLLEFQQQCYLYKRHLRLNLIIEKIRKELFTNVIELKNELQAFEQQRNQIIQKGKTTEKRLRTTFDSRISELSQWLEYSNLLSNYRSSISEALKNESFKILETNTLRPRLEAKVSSINEVCREIADTYVLRVNELHISLLPEPTVYWPSPPTFNLWGKIKNFFTNNEKKAWDYYHETRDRVAAESATEYLTKFRQEALGQLTLFSKELRTSIRYNPPEIPADILEKQNYYSELNDILGQIDGIGQIKKYKISRIKKIQAYLRYIIVFIRLHYNYLRLHHKVES